MSLQYSFTYYKEARIWTKYWKFVNRHFIIQTWCLLSEIYFSKNGHTYVWHVQNDRCHRICFPVSNIQNWEIGWLCWGLTSQSTIFQSCRDGAITSWVINQYFRGVKCLAQGHNTAAVGLEPRTSRSGVRHSTTEPPRSPKIGKCHETHFSFS